MINSLNEPSIVPDIPDEQVIAQAMNLISALGAPKDIKQLLSDLEVAVKTYRKLVGTATALKAEIDRREIDLCEREGAVKIATTRNAELSAATNTLKANIEHRESVLTKSQTDFNEKRNDAVIYLDAMLSNIDAIRKGIKGLINV